MQTSQHPRRKTVLWVLGVAAYGLAATGLTVWWSQNLQALWLLWDKLLPNVLWGGKFAY